MRRRSLFESEGGTLTLSSNSGTAGASNGSSVSFTVYWNNTTLTDSSVVVSSNQTWATPTWAASTSTVKVTCTSNTDLNNTRSATITVTYKGVSETYSLTQSAGTLSLSSNSSSVCGGSGSLTFDINVNGSTYSGSSTVSDDQSWVTTSKRSGTVTVSFTANTGTDTSGSSRTATITVTVQGQSKTYTLTQRYAITITSLPYDGEVDGYKYITLAGLKWCINNVGASSDGAYGNYYAWGETTTKREYSENNYKFGKNASSMTKYNSTDGLMVLESTDDTATVNMGGGWRMPIHNESIALKSNRNTNFMAAVYNNIAGGLLIDKSDASKYIFFPFAGIKRYSYPASGIGSYTYISTAERYSTASSMTDYAMNLNVSCSETSSVGTGRYYGCVVRGVHD